MTTLLWRGSCTGAEDTRSVGDSLAAVVRAGDVLVLTGPLGAGKTTLIQGLARGLGSTEPVTSPTFVLARELRDGRLPLIHVDAYRLGSGWELDDLDLDTDLADSVVAVEWGEGVAERLAADRLEVSLDRGAADESRRVTVHGIGGRWDGISIRPALPATEPGARRAEAGR